MAVFGGTKEAPSPPKVKTTAFQFAPLGLAPFSENTCGVRKEAEGIARRIQQASIQHQIETKREKLKKRNFAVTLTQINRGKIGAKLQHERRRFGTCIGAFTSWGFQRGPGGIVRRRISCKIEGKENLTLNLN